MSKPALVFCLHSRNKTFVIAVINYAVAVMYNFICNHLYVVML